jgi:hypothetical protein
MPSRRSVLPGLIGMSRSSTTRRRRPSHVGGLHRRDLAPAGPARHCLFAAAAVRCVPPAISGHSPDARPRNSLVFATAVRAAGATMPSRRNSLAMRIARLQAAHRSGSRSASGNFAPDLRGRAVRSSPRTRRSDPRARRTEGEGVVYAVGASCSFRGSVSRWTRARGLRRAGRRARAPIAIANPEPAPYGKARRRSKKGLWMRSRRTGRECAPDGPVRDTGGVDGGIPYSIASPRLGERGARAVPSRCTTDRQRMVL